FAKGRCGNSLFAVVRGEFEQVTIGVADEQRVRNASVLRSIELNLQISQLDHGFDEGVGREVKGKMLDADLAIQVVDYRRLRPLEQPDLHLPELYEPGGLPLVKDLEAEDLLVPVERCLEVLDADGEMIDEVELH